MMKTMATLHNFQFGISSRTRKSPFFDATVNDGAQGMTAYNHMLMPTWFDSPLADYWHLIENVTMWDVAVQRQVEITGPDAVELVSLISPRNIDKTVVGRCYYSPLVDKNGCLLNDPVLLRLAKDHFWFSVADTDIHLWIKGLAYGLGYDVTVTEPDVSPMAIQGPNWMPVCQSLLGDWVAELDFFHFKEFDMDGIPLVVARSGWSKQGGIEIYLRDSNRGVELWERVKAAGKPWNIRPGTPSTIERIESGLLSYGNDITNEDNPFHVGLDRYCDLNQEKDFVGKAALKRIASEPLDRKLVGVYLDHDDRMSCEHWWPIYQNDNRVGEVRSATWSPLLQENIGFAMLTADSAESFAPLYAETPWGYVQCNLTSIPFVDRVLY